MCTYVGCFRSQSHLISSSLSSAPHLWGRGALPGAVNGNSDAPGINCMTRAFWLTDYRYRSCTFSRGILGFISLFRITRDLDQMEKWSGIVHRWAVGAWVVVTSAPKWGLHINVQLLQPLCTTFHSTVAAPAFVLAFLAIPDIDPFIKTHTHTYTPPWHNNVFWIFPFWYRCLLSAG